MTKRPVIIDGDVAYVTLTKGYTSVIDAADVSLVEGYNWTALETKTDVVYACRGNGKKVIYMHREILNPPDDKVVDHKDRDGLNNRRNNLRECSKTENAYNVKKHKDNSSGYKGVTWDKSRGKWKSQLSLSGKNTFLGRFDTPEEAFRVYCEANEKYHKEFGNTGETI